MDKKLPHSSEEAAFVSIQNYQANIGAGINVISNVADVGGILPDE